MTISLATGRILLRQARFRRINSSSYQTSRSLSKPTNQSSQSKSQGVDAKEKERIEQRKKTMAELDEEVRAKLEGRSGDGGAAGLELEGGKPVAMKRGVRENMFRLI